MTTSHSTTLDWVAIAKAAGRHGVRYRTNAALEAFLAEISPASPPAEALPSQTSGSEAGGDDPKEVRDLAWKMWVEDQPGIIWTADNKKTYRAKARAALAKPASEPAGGGVDWRRVIRDAFVAGCNAQRERSLLTAGEYADRRIAALSSPASSSPAVAEALQDGVDAVRDLRDRLFGRPNGKLTILCLAYNAFMRADQPNAEDGGKRDWFNDTLPELEPVLREMRAEFDAAIASLSSAPAQEDVDPSDLQLLMNLKRDNVFDGSRPVLTKSGPEMERAFRLSDAGLIALEQVAMGVRLHITRKGVAALRTCIASEG